MRGRTKDLFIPVVAKYYLKKWRLRSAGRQWVFAGPFFEFMERINEIAGRKIKNLGIRAREQDVYFKAVKTRGNDNLLLYFGGQ